MVIHSGSMPKYRAKLFFSSMHSGSGYFWARELMFILTGSYCLSGSTKRIDAGAPVESDKTRVYGMNATMRAGFHPLADNNLLFSH